MSIRWLDGHILWSGGHIAHSDNCCCDPCIGCGESGGVAITQHNVTIAVSGNTYAPCNDADGSYAFYTYTKSSTRCEWIWKMHFTGSPETYWTFYIWYTIATGVWSMYLTDAPSERTWSLDNASVSCNASTGLLSGSGVLARDPEPCTEDATATIT